MKKSLMVVLTVVAMIFCFTTAVFAQDVVMEKQIKNIFFQS